MSTSIDFNDGTPGSLTNSKPSPADRFGNWNPSALPVTDEEESLGTGQLHVFKFRDDYLVNFELSMIPQGSMGMMLRLARHLKNGGTVTVNTGDNASRSYPTCCLQKGADPQPKLTDRKLLEYTMNFALRNVDASPVDFICIY